MLEATAATVKVVMYGAALSAVGVTFARTTLFVREDRSLAFISRGARFAGLLLSATACLTALIYFLRLGGNLEAAVISTIFVSPLGVALAFQVLGGVWLAHKPQSFGAVFASFLILLSFMIIGHASSIGTISSVAVVLHLAAAAWWIGGLWILFFTSLRWHEVLFSALVIRFSQQATRAVAILLTGALLAAGLLLNLRFDITADYLCILLAKAGLTLVLMALAAVNKLLITPRLTSQPRASLWLRRMIILEFVFLASVIVATGVLTTYTSPFQHD